MQIKVVLVAGARPNFMKVAPLMSALAEDDSFSVSLVHTGQHFDDRMSGSFFRDLGIPAPDHDLGVGSGSHAQQTAEIMRRIEPVLIGIAPRAVIVVGDVNSTVAAALVAKKLNLDLVHAEAGLRSFDRTMPEEINRIVTDAISDVLLVTESSGVANLEREGVPAARIDLIGNLMVDSLRKNLARALESEIAARLGIANTRFGLVTLHRPANVDDPAQLLQILEALAVVSKQIPLYWPVHPRTRTTLESATLKVPEGIHLLEPLGYLDFLCLQAQSHVVFTDSGGIQEETTVLGVPCLTLRENTERPATIECGTNRLAGVSTESILAAWRETVDSPKRGSIPPLWDGHAGVRAREALRRRFLGASA